jgi:hypothetical protein
MMPRAACFARRVGSEREIPMPKTQKSAGMRIVVVEGERSYLLIGDRDKLLLRDAALPELLHQGWKVHETHAAGERLYITLTGLPVPPPETDAEFERWRALVQIIVDMPDEERTRLAAEQREIEQKET